MGQGPKKIGSNLFTQSKHKNLTKITGIYIPQNSPETLFNAVLLDNISEGNICPLLLSSFQVYGLMQRQYANTLVKLDMLVRVLNILFGILPYIP